MALADFAAVVAFHGHCCPGLAMGYRAAVAAMTRLGLARAKDEDLVVVVENDSCAVDGFQVVAGCTFGKGNLVFRDYGKQVYTLFDRRRQEGVRLAVCWPGVSESEEEQEAWRRYLAGDRSDRVARIVERTRQRKMAAILAAAEEELFCFGPPQEPLPERARLHPTVACDRCGERVMAPRVVRWHDRSLCRPCADREAASS